MGSARHRQHRHRQSRGTGARQAWPRGIAVAECGRRGARVSAVPAPGHSAHCQGCQCCYQEPGGSGRAEPSRAVPAAGRDRLHRGLGEGFQSLSCAAWHGGAAAVTVAPGPAETGCGGHPCCALTRLPHPWLARGLQVPVGSSFSSWPEGDGSQAAPTSLPATRRAPRLRVALPGTPGTAPDAQPARSHLKENVLHLTRKALRGWGPACPCLALVAWRPAWVS